jgi:hypothetical protein
MARKKPARPAAKRAKKKAAPSGARRKAAKQAVRKAVKRAGSAAKSARSSARKVAKKAVSKARTIVRAAGKTKTGKAATAAVGRAAKVAASTRAGKVVKRAVVNVKAVKAGVVAALTPPKGKKANIDRPRKTVADIHGTPSSLDMGSLSSAARSGAKELKDKIRRNTSASPALTAGDVDADWQSAEAVGDEAPGGDNPTPDQDVVDEIGRALGVEYEDDEELQGGAEIAERDTHRWELDPSSKDDFDDEEK